MDLRGARCLSQTARRHSKNRVKAIREIGVDLLKDVWPTLASMQLDCVKVLANLQEMDKTTEFEMWWITKDGKLVHNSTTLTEYVQAAQ